MRDLFNTRFKKIIALALALLTVASGLTVMSFASGSVEPFEILEDYCIYTEYRANDGVIGIPVGICTYTKEAKADTSTKATEIVFYLMNYNDLGENNSNEDDLAIIYDLVDSGYLVVTLDYFGNEKACYPALTNSVQKIKTSSLSTILNGYSYLSTVRRVIPSGYRITSDIMFFNQIENAPKGVKESTVFSAWNSSGFEEKYNAVRASNPSMPAYQEYDNYLDLYKPDGSPIDFRMYLDVYYPSRPKTDDTPVICWASSAQETAGNHATKVERPHDVEAVLRGYALALYDHGYYPMAREDHYDYFNPYGIQSQIGIHTHAAAIRCVRYYSYLFGYGTDNYGGFGHSKSALIASLANPHPELLPEQSTFAKSYTWNEKKYDASYYRNEKYGDLPYLAYKDSDETIPSNLQFCYSSMGLGVELHARNHNASTAPMFTASGISDQYRQWEFWSEQLNTFNQSGSNYIGLSFLDKGHEYVFGANAVYGFNELDLAFDYIDYFLKDGISPRVGFFTTDGIAEVTTDSGVGVQFTGSISEASIYSGVTLTDTTENKEIAFTATSIGNGAKWNFYAKDGFVEGHSYRLDIGATVAGANGVVIQSPESATFICANSPKVVACSAELFNKSISYYSTVAFQFSAPMDAASLKRNTTVLRKTTTNGTSVEEYITPVFEVVGDNTLWTIASSTHSTNKWGDSDTTTKYEYTITIGANACATNGAPMGQDYVITFRTK